MPFYSDLNQVKQDLAKFEEIPLTAAEENRLLQRFQRNIHPRKRKKNWLSIGIAAAAVCILSLSLTIEKGTIASMPFIGESIEKYINQIEPADYTSYKTAIGETAENELGKLTLNEVMADDKHLFLSATFEPAESVEFDYRTHIQPSIKINGQDITSTTGGQSIELNNSMFTIYNDLELTQAILSEELSIEISYDRWNFEQTIKQPWQFNVKVSQKKLLADRKERALNQKVTLQNGETITIDKVVSTAISTTVYYDATQSESEDIDIDIETENRTVGEYPGRSFISNEPGATSFKRFEGLILGNGDYSLIFRNAEGKVLSDPILIK